MCPSSAWSGRVAACGLSVLVAITVLSGCKRSEPPSDPLKSQREAMERAKDVGTTMQKGVDEQGRKSDEEGK